MNERSLLSRRTSERGPTIVSQVSISSGFKRGDGHADRIGAAKNCHGAWPLENRFPAQEAPGR